MIKRGSDMPTIFDIIYREYCRARLAEMRKQLLIAVVSDELLDAHRDGSDPADPDNRMAVGTTEQRKKSQPSSSRNS